jgi:hypothetical protein
MSVSLATIGSTLGKTSNTSLVDVSSATGGGTTIHTRTKASSGYRRVNPLEGGDHPDGSANHSLLEFENYNHSTVGVGSNFDVTSVGGNTFTIGWSNHLGTMPAGTPPCTENVIHYRVYTSPNDDPFTSSIIYLPDQAGSVTSITLSLDALDGSNNLITYVVGVRHRFTDADTSTTVKYNDSTTTGHTCKSTLTNGTKNGSSDGIIIAPEPLSPQLIQSRQITVAGYLVDCEEENELDDNYFEFGNTGYAKNTVNMFGMSGLIDIGWNTTNTTPSDGSNANVEVVSNTSSNSSISIGTVNHTVPSTTYYFWARYAGRSPEGHWSNKGQFISCGQDEGGAA